MFPPKIALGRRTLGTLSSLKKDKKPLNDEFCIRCHVYLLSLLMYRLRWTWGLWAHLETPRQQRAPWQVRLQDIFLLLQHEAHPGSWSLELTMKE